MLLIEKVLILRSSEIFRNTPEQELVDLAAVLEEIIIVPGTKLFSKGDHGNCMYFIVRGEIRIHDGEHTLALLDDGEIVGELSLMDSERRSGDATSTQESVILKLDQEPFFEIIMNNADILKGILKTLCKRLRTINEKSVAAGRSV